MSLPWSVRWSCPRRAWRRWSGCRRPAARARACRRRRAGCGRCALTVMKPRPSSRTRSTVRPTKLSSTSTLRRAGVLDDVGEALLGDAVDHELLLVGEQRDVAGRARRSCVRMPVRSPKVATWVASAGTSPWSSSAVGRSSRARCSSSSIAWVASCLVSAARRRGASGASEIVACEPQQDAGQRLVDLVVEVLRDPRALLLLRAQHGAAGLAALVLEAVHHAVEVGGAGAGPRWRRRARRRRACRGRRGRPRSSSPRAGPSAPAGGAAAAS